VGAIWPWDSAWRGFWSKLDAPGRAADPYKKEARAMPHAFDLS